MLFSSYGFLFLFLPVTLFGFWKIGARGHHRVAISFLVAASLFFYGWWNPLYLWLILGSIFFNYAVGIYLGGRPQPSRLMLALGVAANLSVLGYYKYANFFIENLDQMAGVEIQINTIVLPLAISFFTFQQIAYLVDAWRGETREYNFLHYCLFVTFFPQLIAGPIVHHKEMLPQFAHDAIYKLNYSNLAVGITILGLGLFKKVVLADSIAVYASPVFGAAEAGVQLTFFQAWAGALAYTLQLYFDFSGYSDMAIGLARMFGIRLPLNFNSPYKATNIIDFWRRWHMTLSRFLRDYLYIALGGSRKGSVRRHMNLMITMVLGGLWHGAGWTFVAWGALHGVYLTVNHFWRTMRKAMGHDLTRHTAFGRGASLLLTFVAVVVGWVFFRAESLNGAIAILSAMMGQNGIAMPGFLEAVIPFEVEWLTYSTWLGYDGTATVFAWIALLLLIVWMGPNSQQIMRRFRPAFENYPGEIRQWRYSVGEWQPTIPWAVASGVVIWLAIVHLANPSEFLYFQF